MVSSSGVPWMTSPLSVPTMRMAPSPLAVSASLREGRYPRIVTCPVPPRIRDGGGLVNPEAFGSGVFDVGILSDADLSRQRQQPVEVQLALELRGQRVEGGLDAGLVGGRADLARG